MHDPDALTDLGNRFRTRLPLYQVDAFTTEVFGGNPAAVCPLPRWLPDALLRLIAAENALPETAFFVGGGDRFEIRWFTPDGVEMDLCGHATLATAHVLARHLNPGLETICFGTRLGDTLTVTVAVDGITLDFPARPPLPAQAPTAVLDALGLDPAQVRESLHARDWMLVLDDAQHVRALRPDPARLQQLPGGAHGIIVTAPGSTGDTGDAAGTTDAANRAHKADMQAGGEAIDFVSRFFLPGSTMTEDPVTGSAHCSLLPYWAQRLGRHRLLATQLSARGGLLYGELAGERVRLTGQAVTYLEGTITV